jgi:hypothetical protein
LISLSLALVAWGWVARSSFCLDSNLVEKIDMIGTGGKQSITACSVARDGRFSETLFDLKTGFEVRFHSLQRSLDFLGFQFEKIHLSIVDTVDPLVRVHPSHLILSRSVLDAKNVLEKALLLSLLQQKRQDPYRALSADEVLWADVFTDVFLHFEKGGLEIADPLLNQSFRWDEQRSNWPFVLKTKSVYCQDASRSFLYMNDCQQGRLSPDQLLTSLRPLLGLSLASALEKLGPGERIKWFHDVWANWDALQMRRAFFGSSVGPEDQQELVDGARLIQSWTQNFQTWAKRDTVWAQVAARLPLELQARGFREDRGPLKSDYLVLVTSPESESILQGLREATLLDTKKSVVLVRGNEAWLLPDLHPFPKAWLGEFNVQQALLIQCQIPSTDKLRALANQVQKLMLIRACPPLQTVAWNKLLTQGVDAFLKANPKVPFVQFHLPSLRAALLKRNLNPIPLLDDGNWESPFFHQIGWEKPDWDQDLHAFRTHAAIDAIEIFRLQEKGTTAL